MARWVRAFLATGLIAAISISGPQAAEKKEQSPADNDVFAGLKLRSMGPALTSGRITDFAVNPEKTAEYYAATASGGLWKTSNAGTTWTPVFDREKSYSIGVVEIDPKNPNIIWVGSGENNSQRSVAYGDGVYKSIDAGKSWKRVGLQESEHIGQIIVDPRDSNVVYVAAQGPLWNEGGERGLYRTRDGGQTWDRILHIDEHTGINEIVQHPLRPDYLVASSYQRRRHLWTLIDGGPGSGIHRSTDSGESWVEITSGIPDGDKGRIGLAMAPSNPDLLYAIIEADEENQGVYRSTDFGATWQKRSSRMTGSPQYYNELVVDPHNPDRVYLMDTFLSVSEDGGKTWKRLGIKHKHVDEHVLWIDPADTDHLLTGNDGGIYESFDRGENWRHIKNLPITQFYRATPDYDFPFYNVYGGTQDNNSLGAPSRTRNIHGITNADWVITLGGDGFETQIDPTNPDIIYSQLQYGNLVRYDRKTGERVYITPQPGGEENDYRWNWNSALIISPHNNKRLYYAAEKIFRSDDMGDSWQAVSPDLSRRIDRNTLEVMGRVWSVDAIAKNMSTSLWGSVISLTESRLQEGLIYAGTDDGLIQVTDDGGQNWTKLKQIKDLPEIIYVGDLETSLHDVDTIFAAFDNHKVGDFKPYLYKSTDRGRTWVSIAGNLPERGTVHTIVQDHIDPDLLFAGTEFALFYSQDGGQQWHQLKAGIPTIAVRDLEIQRRENDLVVATFGRGFYILDDYTPLRTKAADTDSREATLFGVKDPWLYVERTRWGGSKKGSQGEDFYAAPNPPFGAIFSYHLKDGLKTLKQARRKAEQKVQEDGGGNPYPSWEELRAEDREEEPAIIFTIMNADGDVVRRLTGPTAKGFHRVAWDLRFPSSTPVSLKPQQGGFFGPPKGPMVAPGTYTVSMAKRVDGEIVEIGQSQAFTVKLLEGATFRAADLNALSAEHRKFADFQRAVMGAGRAVDEIKVRIEHLKKGFLETATVNEAQNQRLREIEGRLQDLNLTLDGDTSLSSRQAPTPASISSRLFAYSFFQMNTLAEVSENLRHSMRIAGQQFVGVLEAMRGVAADLSALEAELGAEVPWTPGRIPDWKNE